MGNKFRDKIVEDELVSPKQAAEADEERSTATDEQASSTDAQGSRRKTWVGRTLRGAGHVLGGDVLGDKMVLKQIPLLLLCLVYLLLIVGNRYRIERLSREKIATEERINYLREERIQMQRQYQQSVKISQIATDLKERGVGITAGPPYEL